MPLAGSGVFLLPILQRLVASRPATRKWDDLGSSVRGWEVPPRRLAALRWACADTLLAAGCPRATAQTLAQQWLSTHGGAMNTGPVAQADVAVAGPAGAAALEGSLDLLAHGGSLGFIGPDHWQRSEAGRRLRAKIATRGFAVDAVITFDADVAGVTSADASGASAITVIRRGPQEEAAVVHLNSTFGARDTESLLDWLDFGAMRLDTPCASATRVTRWPTTSAPWDLPRG
jgi:hypothetical protein